jgi:peptidyl-prolyl cis-trans isomerase SurA
MPDGSISTIIVNPADGNSSFVKIIHHYNAGMQRSFTEAKGLVINDYQNKLEDNWIESLKKKYPIKINEAVFQSVVK